MKKNKPTWILERLILLFLTLAIPFSLSAQDKTDYHLKLNSRHYVPVENINNLSKDDIVFQKNLFKNNYYVLIQFKQLPTQAQKDELKSDGIELMQYIPSNAFTAKVSASTSMSKLQSPLFRSITCFEAQDKTVPLIFSGDKVPDYAIKQSGFVDLSILTYEKIDATEIQEDLGNLGASILEDHQAFENFIVRIPQSNISQLLNLPFIQWVEFIQAPLKLQNTAGRSMHRANLLNDGVRNLKGDSVNIGVWDGGDVQSHLDFLPMGRLTLVDNSGPNNHATHVGGTIGGRGLISPTTRGMAPNAKIFSYDFFGSVINEMNAEIPLRNLDVSNHSYGNATASCGINGANVVYSIFARSTDILLGNNPNHLQCFAAANYQAACAGGWHTLGGDGAPAKNNIVVGNITNSESLNNASSYGPTQDGRIKPEICALGSSVYSTALNNTYAYRTGTSMATPGVAGTAALLVQRYKQLNNNTLPPSSLIKNVILNSAKDLGNPGPDYRYGYGRINSLEAVKILETNRYVVASISTGNTNNQIIAVPPGASKLRVMLTWNDPAGATNASPALINNLDLSVINGASTTLPWTLDPINPANNAVRAIDVVSNVEQVSIDNPTAGSYTLSVNGLAVPTGPNQIYSLSWSVEMPNIEITYPNGNESFNPTSSETIRWNSAGVTASQTIEYSLNNGASWTTLSSTLGPNTNHYDWTPIPNANTSQALIRITSGALTDQSDSSFNILGTPTGLVGVNTATCNPGEVKLSWNATANASFYEILSLDTVSGNFQVLANYVVGTSYTATGLPVNSNMWFSIRAKHNTSFAVSERSDAIIVTTSASGIGPAMPALITGTDSICGAGMTLGYSIAPVAGATNYIWTILPGTTIASGQGTTNLNLSYNSNVISLTGFLTVTASDGSCTSNPSSILLNLFPEPTVNASASSNSICSGDAVALTASGTAASFLWAPGNLAGANQSVSPTTSTNYTVTGTDANGFCSATSSVSVTVNPMSSAPIANGVRVCSGEDATLYASGANNYRWYTNATNTTAISSTDSLTLTNIQSNSTYYVESSNDTKSAVGPVNNTIGMGGNYSGFSDGLVFDANTEIILDSLTIYPGGAGNVTVNLLNAANILIATSTVAVTVAGMQQIPIGFTIPAGVGYKLNAFGSTVPGLFRNSAGAVYPYTDGNITIGGAINNLANFYYFFYRWKITIPGCSSSRIPVNVTVNPIPTPISVNPLTVCSGEDATLLATPGILPFTPYCSSIAYSNIDTKIDSVSFAGISVGTAPINGGEIYTDNTSTVIPVLAGSTYPLFIVKGDNNGGAFFAAWVKVYIDYNQNGLFEISEELYSFGAPNTLNSIPPTSITIPTSAFSGRTRMRIVLNESGSATNTQACGIYNYGETEDYTIEIFGGTAAPLGFTDIAWSPSASLNMANGDSVIAQGISTTTLFTAIGTDKNGCTSSDSATVSVIPSPVVTVSPTSLNNCAGSSNYAIASGGLSHSWMPGATTGDTLFIPANTTSNTYVVTGTAANGCSDTASVLLTQVAPSGDLTQATLGNAASTNGTQTGGFIHPNDGLMYSYYDANCAIIASVQETAAGISLGQLTSTATVEATLPSHNGQPYVARWFDLSPTNQGPATITLYLTDDDILDYNANNGGFADWPTNAGSATTIPTNLVSITKTNGTLGAPGASIELAPTSITWNTADSRWEVVFNTAGFSEFRLHGANPNGAGLPVSLRDFSVEKLSSTDLVKWTTATESNNSHFLVQRSSDGFAFENLGKEDSKALNGNSSEELNYSFVDQSPQIGHNYYRLEQVDIDGRKDYSDVIDIIWTELGSIVLYPNPTKDILNIDFSQSSAAKVQVKLFDMSGRVVKSISRTSLSGVNKLQISMSELANGVYNVQLTENNNLLYQGKVTKQ